MKYEIDHNLGLFKNIIENSPDSFIIFTNNGTVLYQNLSSKNLFDSKFRIGNGDNFFDKVHVNDIETLKTKCKILSKESINIARIQFKLKKTNDEWYLLDSELQINTIDSENYIIVLKYNCLSNDFALMSTEQKFRKLNEMFSEMVQLNNLKEIYEYITTKLHAFYPHNLLIFNSIEHSKLKTTLETVAGLKEGVIGNLMDLVGYSPIGKIYELTPEHIKYIKSGKFVAFEGGLSEFSASAVSPMIAKAIEKVLGINKIYTVGISKDNVLFASIHFFSLSKKNTYDIDFIELFVNQAGIILEKKTAESELKFSNTKLSALINTLPDMIFIQDVNGTYLDYFIPKNIQTHNPQKVQPGNTISQVLQNELSAKFINIFERTIESGNIEYLQYSLQVVDTERFYEARIIKFDHNKVLSIVRDITDKHKLEQAILNQNTELEKLVAAKNQFMSILAHDLKSPFNTIFCFSELLLKNLRKYDIDRIEKQLNYIYQTSEQTYNLLEDLLSWSQSSEGKIPFTPEKLTFKELCNEFINGFANQAQAKEISISCFEQETKDVYADVNMFKTIFRNLISNAIKFTHHKGQIDIYTEISGNSLIITVSDNGVGISDDVQKNIFSTNEPYTTMGTGEEKGTGFGLLLCRDFVEKHGGKIWVESKLGVGSAFKFTLPIFNENLHQTNENID